MRLNFNRPSIFWTKYFFDYHLIEIQFSFNTIFLLPYLCCFYYASYNYGITIAFLNISVRISKDEMPF